MSVVIDVMSLGRNVCRRRACGGANGSFPVPFAPELSVRNRPELSVWIVPLLTIAV